jgi:hypothetical protein
LNAVKRLVAFSLVLAAALPAAAAGGGAPVALLIPARHACVGAATITLGVRYTNNPPGARRYSVEILAPDGKTAFTRSGRAPSRWRKWTYAPRATGTYRTTYRLAWGIERFRTRVKVC